MVTVVTAATIQAPDIAIVGSARSGSTFLSGMLLDHPLIDGAAVKEPDFFSFNLFRGVDWYNDLFPPRKPGHLRLDASVSYTYSEANGALDQLAAVSPEVQVIYLVREPIERMISHFVHYRDYANLEPNRHLGSALGRSHDYVGASDYALWLDKMTRVFPRDRVLVVPFSQLTTEPQSVLNEILGRCGLPFVPVSSDADIFKNTSARPRNELFGALLQHVLASPLYPYMRRSLGPSRIRKIRRMVTRENPPHSRAEFATLRPEQRVAIEEMRRRSVDAVGAWLATQDRIVGCQWSSKWDSECAG